MIYRTKLVADEGWKGMVGEWRFVRSRIVRRFLWRRMTIDGKKRWLCMARWREDFVDGAWQAVAWE